ncbi:MAG: AAA family ATPase [DPANN group archaeon]|nr:AAA family ATPase [DPANN group archaeon]
MIITISGTPGAGKSTVADVLAKKLHMKRYSIGDLRGKMAKERGLTIDEFNRIGEKEAFTDRDADAYQKRLGETEDNFIIDGRLSFHFIPQSFKLFLKCDAAVGAARIYKDLANRSDEASYGSPEEVAAAIAERMASDSRRYQKYYGLDPLKEELYDLVIDTTSMTVDEVAEQVLLHLPVHPPK